MPPLNIETKKCPACRGSGLQRNNDGIKETCPVCNGSGEVRESFGCDDGLGKIADYRTSFGSLECEETNLRDIQLDNCLHDALEESKPIGQKGGAHNLVCNCPKCRTIC